MRGIFFFLMCLRHRESTRQNPAKRTPNVSRGRGEDRRGCDGDQTETPPSGDGDARHRMPDAAPEGRGAASGRGQVRGAGVARKEEGDSRSSQIRASGPWSPRAGKGGPGLGQPGAVGGACEEGRAPSPVLRRACRET